MGIRDLIGKRILVLDGAMGTAIQAFGLCEQDFRQNPSTGERPFKTAVSSLSGDNECLCLTRPDVIGKIHRSYIEAGADIIETCSFGANPISQTEYGLADYAARMAFASAKIAREAADRAVRKVFVAGSMGPTSKSLTLASDLGRPSYRQYSFSEMCEAYRVQAKALVDGGADLLLLETCFDALNTKAGIYAIEKLEDEGLIPSGFPLIISVSANDKSGRTLTGQTIEAFWTSVRHYPLAAFGLNCSLGAEDLEPLIRDVASFCDVPVICYPNAGLPNELGQYDQKPEDFAKAVRRMAGEGLIDIIGGCCGTTPEHIRAAREAVRDFKPRSAYPREEGQKPLTVSGLEAFTIDPSKNFTNIGERTNVAGSRKFAKLIAAKDYDSALKIAADQIANGANIIDINMDDAMLDSGTEMETFLRSISSDPLVAKAALMIDSSHWETILLGLENAQGRCVVNSISLKDGEEDFLRKAWTIHEMGAAMVIMAFDEKGQATSYSRKIEVCERAYKLLSARGIRPEEMIFDCNVLSVGTGIAEHAAYGIDFIRAVRWIKENLPGAKTSGGISNLSFAFRGNNKVREAMHSVFLYHAIKAGLDMGIVNPGMLQVYDGIEPELLKCCEDVILDRDPEATERLVAKASEIMAEKEAGKDASPAAAEASVREGSLEERLAAMLVSGTEDNLKEDVMEALGKLSSAVKVIEGPLMAGMEKVGELFGEGKMFLPQVVKSAKVMRDAVSILEPYMKKAGEEGGKRPVIINATVKGDVHDIGKNITGIVLGCNGFEVIDLGVMVDKDTILKAAEEHKAAIIGVSGLITPSLFQMEEICREMKRRGLDTPLFIGGATTSALHTAVKLSPLYGHVFYAPDASASAVMAKKCVMDREGFEREQHEAQAKMRSLYEARKIQAASVSEGPLFPKESFLRPGDHDLPSEFSADIQAALLKDFIDWRMFLAIWGFKYGAQLPDSPDLRKTLADGRAILERFIADGSLRIHLSLRFMEAFSDGSDLVFPKSGGRVSPAQAEEVFRLPMLRQEEPQEIGGKRVCAALSDYAPDKAYGFTAPVGIFAISVHYVDKNVKYGKGSDCGTDYDSMMERAVRVCLAEAASAWLDTRIKARLKRKDMKITKPAAGYASCPDHSLKGDILSLLPGRDELGIELTESYAMIPDASICGFVIVHPNATYPEIRKIGRRQYEDYARRRGMTEDQARRFLGHLL